MFIRKLFATGMLPLRWIMFIILCWNCQGDRKKATGNYLRHLIGVQNVSFVGLVETKIESFSRTEIDRLVGRNWDFYFQPSVGRAGGILVLWKSTVGSFQVIFQSAQCIMGRFCNLSAITWEVAVIYADKDRYVDKKGGRPFTYTAAACEMGDFMATNGLIDPGFSSPAFTWTNNKDARRWISSRLDRFLISSSILDVFQELRVQHLMRLASDHCPILCSTLEQQRRALSHWIRFEDVWAGFPKAWNLVADKWIVNDTGSEASKLHKKCQRTLKALFFWSKKKLRMLNQLKDELDKEIKDLHELQCSPAGLYDVQYDALRYKVQMMNSTLARLTMWWRLGANVKWIEEGDGITHFFHSMASARRRSNSINKLKDRDGHTVTDQADVMRVIHHFFEQNWSWLQVTESGWPCLDPHAAILGHVADMLDREVTEEEVWDVVRELGPNCAPGRDGVTVSFF
ncbi:uncharacterized protein LOC110103302 [Dendrobium catenatum]|uniref:uncharacterized protein LOC110103302 n=1 Tax=Dendrobium catenatum TaxID=906689 RepID=UPI0010A01D16|nr:uncharacterized protein LOC110103302 [Dendrobium catenatum]